MIEIEFRGKLKSCKNGEWVYGLPHHCDGQTMILSDNVVDYSDEYEYCEYWYLVDETTIGQYTGLKDKNGNKIYDGDIVHANIGTDVFIDGIVKYGTYYHDKEELTSTQIGYYIEWDGKISLSDILKQSLSFWVECTDISGGIEVIGDIFEKE